MKQTIILALLACLMVIGSASRSSLIVQARQPVQLPATELSAPQSSIAQIAPHQAPSSSLQDSLYLSDRFGFRFVRPSGYVIETVTDNFPSQPATPLQVLQLWQQADFLNRMNLPELPPLITLTIYPNPQRLPLSQWKGELAHNDDRPLTVAGQSAIAFSATGLYESDNVLFSSPDGNQVFHLRAGYRGADEEIRQVCQDLTASFTFGES
jgi:hypothetical protein